MAKRKIDESNFNNFMAKIESIKKEKEEEEKQRKKELGGETTDNVFEGSTLNLQVPKQKEKKRKREEKEKKNKKAKEIKMIMKEEKDIRKCLKEDIIISMKEELVENEKEELFHEIQPSEDMDMFYVGMEVPFSDHAGMDVDL